MKTDLLIAALALLTLNCGGNGGSDGGTGPLPVAVASVTVTPAQDTLIPGETIQLASVARDANGGSIGGRAITWTSSSNAIAAVSQLGVVSGVGEGAASITATVDGVSGSAAVTVRFPFPNAAGTYAVSGSFDNNPTTFSGTVTIVQNSRLAGALTGNASVTLASATGPLALNGAFTALMDADGKVAFTVDFVNSSATWAFDGQLAGNSITGSHTLRVGTSAFPGSWQAVRAGPLTAFAQVSGAASRPSSLSSIAEAFEQTRALR